MQYKYPIKIEYNAEDNDYIVSVPDLPGCSAFGDTPEEAVHEAHTAIELWLDSARQIGKPIPKPSSHEDYSGKFMLRIPKSLHHALADRAQDEGTSLNQLALYYLSTSMGVSTPKVPERN
jgi:predicted RNase H-like HicB family nuclease